MVRRSTVSKLFPILTGPAWAFILTACGGGGGGPSTGARTPPVTTTNSDPDTDQDNTNQDQDQDDGGTRPPSPALMITSASSGRMAQGEVIYTGRTNTSADPVTWRLSGADAGLFTVNTAGQVRFSGDDRGADGQTRYSFTLTARRTIDGSTTTDSQLVTLGLARPSGGAQTVSPASSWEDPDMRDWQSGDHYLTKLGSYGPGGAAASQTNTNAGTAERGRSDNRPPSENTAQQARPPPRLISLRSPVRAIVWSLSIQGLMLIMP